MHFALPPRKHSNPSSPYPFHSFRAHALRGGRLRYIGIIAAAALFGVYLLTRLVGGSAGPLIPFGTPPVVVVTTIDPETMGDSYIETIKENRQHYASRHGYATFFPNTTDYPLNSSPRSWSKMPALRHAMAEWPHSTYFLWLGPTALIMNPALAVEAHIMAPARLESLILADTPIVPPDSVIRTFDYLSGDRVDLVLTQDADGLAVDAFVLRRGEWAKFFLDAWFDPLYRSYNFQKSETHALEHIVQWHGTVLAKLALVPQRILNAYVGSRSSPGDDVYTEGDFVANFFDCGDDAKRRCEDEMKPLVERWREIRDHGTR